MCVYIDYVLQFELCVDCCCCYVMLFGVGFGDDVGFVYVVCQQDLVQYVVDFVVVGMVQFFVFQIDFGVVQFFGQVWGEIQWVGFVDIMCLQVIYFGLEGWIVFGVIIFVFKVKDQWYQCFVDEMVIENVEMFLFIWVVYEVVDQVFGYGFFCVVLEGSFIFDLLDGKVVLFIGLVWLCG